MEKRKEIFQLLGVIFGAVGLAVVVAAFMLYSYGPTGRYLAQNVLLDPELLPKLSFQEGGGRFTFDHIEIAYFEPSSQNFVKTPLDLDPYRKIYALVGTDRSIRDPSDDVKGEFNRQKLVRLSIVVKPKGDGIGTPFQTVDFAKNCYRVELVEDKKGFAYFDRKGVQEQILDLIADENKS